MNDNNKTHADECPPHTSPTPQEIADTLPHFTGTEHYYRFWFGINYLTDGVKYLADAAECYWLLDAIGSYQPELATHEDRRLHEIQFWKLKVNADNSAVLTCVADGGEPPVITQAIKWTNVPLPEVDIWVQRNADGVFAHLPSEY